MTLQRGDAADDEGSVLLLTLGYAVLAIVLVLVCVDATSLYLTQKRADAAADAAALAGADGFVLTVAGGEATARLTDAGVADQAAQVIDVLGAAGGAVTLVSAGTPDGVSARVTVQTVWHPPVLSIFVPDGWTIDATATSRTALR
ncbi:MAG: hypothetical protein ABS62_09230 [Microbacterium sp. SCN 70-200]|uniref:pilus assembly protein TadG-related protein n=1 Tax=unclassified Microbacterium TaxID=2609290 RepID=UPI00086C75E8|nr:MULTISPECIES: pilus assembly protein TadG-related protein [unclassified Microbacterium]MBN9214482.1 hypothetical protein [Microbacterium sp.]ODT40732.1 MAG: hypothetical protein ABS62_09230 [Microbacterium sp. SCN 70-200]OJV83729.1 MAG: hypothetical protein BGO46_11975 [Microbacterium sp. 70-16]